MGCESLGVVSDPLGGSEDASVSASETSIGVFSPLASLLCDDIVFREEGRRREEREKGVMAKKFALTARRSPTNSASPGQTRRVRGHELRSWALNWGWAGLTFGAEPP